MTQTTGYLPDLAKIARDAGLKVVEVDGWQHRGRSPMRSVDAVVCHHTAGPRTGNMPSLAVVRDGRSDLPGPLCNYGLGRDGTVYVVAAGRANHAGGYYGPGDRRNTTKVQYQNDRTIGIEAEATGTDPWPAAQRDAYARLCAAIVRHYGLAVSDVVGHKESCVPKGRKSDPNFDMNAFRSEVAAVNAPKPVPQSRTDALAALAKMREARRLLNGVADDRVEHPARAAIAERALVGLRGAIGELNDIED